jgi:ketosteroid isomerase-like protein
MGRRAQHHSFPDTVAGEVTPAAAAEREDREVHRHWFDCTATKDLDGLLPHVADDVVSYEHGEPLQYVSLDGVREVCQGGLDAPPDDSNGEVPDLGVMAHEDITVAWRLNRMHAQQPDGQTAESRSRGTRVLQWRGGDWVMIRQHASHPYNPETGEAKTGLRP